MHESFPKQGAHTRHEKPKPSKTLWVSTRDWRDGYGPAIGEADDSRQWTRQYGRKHSAAPTAAIPYWGD